MNEGAQTMDPTLITGIKRVDEDHAALFAKLAEIKKALDDGKPYEQTIEIVFLLQRYTARHFAREEEIMRRVHCPTLEQNIAAHREFTKRVDGWVELLTMGNAPTSFLRDIQAEAVAWITHHISSTDCGLRACAGKSAVVDHSN